MKYLNTTLLLMLLTACSSSTLDDASELTEDEKNLQTEFQYSQTLPKGKIENEDHGEQVWFAYGALQGVEGVPASGVAQSFIFEDGSTQHGLQLNVEIAEEGFFYEGWLVHPETGDTISSGHLRMLFGDVRHVLQFEDAKDLRGYTKVIVTLEPDDGDPNPADHVAEGVLKEVQR